jgi:hypothetical protein
MTRMLDTLRQRIADLLRDLDARPWALFCLLFAANAVALPYQGIYHDAKIYGLLVLNRIYPNHFSDDLFFQYGSQDRYSLFSIVAAPIVSILGLKLGFFLLYVLSNGLLLLALQRFVRALVKDPLISTPALLLLAITQVPFAGLATFHVNEPFLTPRIEANALVLFALERLLAGRLLQTGVLIVAALLLHPLMAFPGLLVILGWLITSYFRPRYIVLGLALATLAAAAVLIDRPLALRLFGRMDDAWRDILNRVYFFIYPLKWTALDWVRIVLSFTVGLIAIGSPWHDARVRRLLILISIVAVLGLAVGVLACFLPYALLLQGQSYRWLWLLAVTLYPLGLSAAQRFWLSARTLPRLASLVLLVCLNAAPWDCLLFVCLLTSAALIGVIYWRGLRAQPYIADWAVRAGIVAVMAVLPLWAAFRLGLVVAFQQQLRPLLEPLGYVNVLIGVIDPLCRLTVVLLALMLLRRPFGLGRGLRLASLTVCVGASLLFFALPQSRIYSENLSRYGRDRCLIADYLAQHPTQGKTPTIYWPCGTLELTWIELRVNSYFDLFQIAGMLFNAPTAWEGERRLQIVKKFEMERFRSEKVLFSEEAAGRFQQIFQLTEADPRPEVKDLLALCREKQLDLVVIPQEFPGWYAARTGHFFIYDCRAIRASLGEGAAPTDKVASLSPERGLAAASTFPSLAGKR